MADCNSTVRKSTEAPETQSGKYPVNGAPFAVRRNEEAKESPYPEIWEVNDAEGNVFARVPEEEAAKYISESLRELKELDCLRLDPGLSLLRASDTLDKAIYLAEFIQSITINNVRPGDGLLLQPAQLNGLHQALQAVIDDTAAARMLIEGARGRL
ncbi:MAG TPA: hypothetical protein VKC56_05715 [Gallionellaceae bacterium]|nr:hypothetical protein [Gallionellaceae bacterium]